MTARIARVATTERRRVPGTAPAAGSRVSFSMRRATSAALFGLLLAASASAQQGATITGTVRDSASRPVANADVVALPGAHRARTDSSGKFTISGIDGGSYTVR